MRVFELEQKISELINAKEINENFTTKLNSLLSEMLSKEITQQAILEAVSRVVTKEQAEEIAKYMHDITQEHTWRYIDADARKQLEEYGYFKPAIVVSEQEAAEYLDKGENIILLFTDNTVAYTQNEAEIKSFILSGGLVAISQITMDKELESIISSNYDYDKD